MKEFIFKFQSSAAKHRMFLIFFSGFLILYIFSNLYHVQKETHQNLLTPDTLIPKGHVLVPIELENIEAITGLIENYGVIDIFLGKKLSQKSQKILSKVKIIRAPYNPNKFAILLNDETAKNFMKFDGPFIGTIQNKSEVNTNTSVQNNETKKNRKIDIEYNGV